MFSLSDNVSTRRNHASARCKITVEMILAVSGIQSGPYLVVYTIQYEVSTSQNLDSLYMFVEPIMRGFHQSQSHIDS